MLRLASPTSSGDRVVLFVPRWLPPGSPHGLPYRAIPVASALLRHGIDVDLAVEPFDGPIADDRRRLDAALDGALAAVAWCAEMNPAEQLPGLRTFLHGAATAAPSVPRFVGGGFVPLAPAEFDYEGLAEPVRGEEVGSLLHHVAALRGERVPARQPFTIDALYAHDLTRYVQPCSLLFGDDAPSLQLPTGFGCGKGCTFCFWEHAPMRLLPANGIADAIEHCVHRYGVRRFQFGELDFLAGPRRALDLALELRARALDVAWFALGSVPDILRLGEAGMRTLAAGGLRVLETGTEAGTDAALRALGKRFTVADAERAHTLLVASGITPVHNFVLGWPGETDADRRGTLALVDRLHRRAPRSVMHFRHYQAIPTTTLGDTVMHHHGPLPRSLTELERWRCAQERRLPWLAPSTERRVRFLAEYLLPLAYGDDLAAAGRAAPARALLRSLARWRCRSGFLRLPVDRALFAATCERGLRATWLR